MAESLESLHAKIDDLTDPDGEYAVVCTHSGKRPVPVRGLSFPTPEVATEAVELVVAYRSLLREVDPYLESVPIVACEEAAQPLSFDASEDGGERDSDSNEHGENADDRPEDRTSQRGNAREATGTITLSDDGDDEWLRLTDAPVVQVRENGEPLDDAVIGLALNTKL